MKERKVLRRYAADPSTGCWLWTGPLDKGGYGLGHLDGRRHGAHRVFWMLLRGSIPGDLTIDHLCRTPRCVNPDHMELVTMGENVLRGNSPSALNRRKTACKRGHPFDSSNTYTPSRGGRACRACHRIREQERENRV